MSMDNFNGDIFSLEFFISQKILVCVMNKHYPAYNIKHEWQKKINERFLEWYYVILIEYLIKSSWEDFLWQ